MTDGIALSGLGHSYDGRNWIFRDYDVAIAAGSVFAILGPNGCGKTPLLKCLLGTLHPAAGSVQCKGQIAFVPQIFQVAFDYSVLDMVLMGRAKSISFFSQPVKHDIAEALAALDHLGMADFAERPFGELSGGQRQLVILARALVAKADVIVMDEPTSALDMKNQSLILEWIGRLSGDLGYTVIFTTHNPAQALAAADDVLLMLGKCEYASGRAPDVLCEESLSRLYGVAIRRVPFEHEGETQVTFSPVYGANCYDSPP